MEVQFKVKGLRELEELMVKSLPATVGRRVLLTSLRKSGDPAVALAQATAIGQSGIRKSGALAASIGMISTRLARSGATHAAAIAIGPISGQAAKPLLAYAMYRSYWKRGKNISSLKRGSPVGSIRHGHFIEFGFNHVRSGKKIPGTHFLENAAAATGATSTIRFRTDLEKRLKATIAKHNAKTSAKGAR